MESLEDLVHLYITSDVLLLDSVLQQYRTQCLNSYNLDPVHYYTAPGLTWDAGLKYTKVELELLKDQEMYTFVEQAIRGGISFQTSKPGFKRFSIFSDKLVGLELVKPTIVLDKPIYLGAAILDLSKLLMYRFWYDVLKVKYSNIKLCFTDTDSLLYWLGLKLPICIKTFKIWPVTLTLVIILLSIPYLI